MNYSPKDLLGTADKKKKAKYSAASEEKDSVYALVLSVDGLIGNEAEIFLKQLGDSLAAKWNKSYSDVMGWLSA